MTNPWDEPPSKPRTKHPTPNPVSKSKNGESIGIILLVTGLFFLIIYIREVSDSTNDIKTTLVTQQQTNIDSTIEVNEAKLGFNPEIACNFLTQLGVTTNGYKPMYENSDSYLCSSYYQELGDQDVLPIPNNLSYYARGSVDTVYRLRILLNVNRVDEEMEGRLALATMATTLTSNALQIAIPPKALLAIQQGKPYKGKRQKYAIEVIKDNWSNGSGYSLEYIIRDPSFNEGT